MYNNSSSSLILVITIIPILAILLILLKKYFNGGRNSNKPDLSGQIVIVTGGCSGLGYETALSLAKLNPRVIITGRAKNWREGLKATLKIKQLSNNEHVYYYPLDLDDLASVTKFIDDFKSNNPERLDILVNNAGVMMLQTQENTKDNIEMQFGVNHLGHFVLTQKLLEIMKKTPKSRIVNLSSVLYKMANIDFQELETSNTTLKQYSPTINYANSKLANILFTKYLQTILNQSQIKAVCLHPGVVRTNLTRFLEKTIWFKSFQILTFPIYWFVTKSQEQGAQTTLHCCTEEFEKLKTGEYYSDCQVQQIYHKQICIENINKLRDYSLKFCNIPKTNQ